VTIRGIRYYGFVDAGGYGLAALANVRALLNARIALQFVPLEWHADAMRPGHWHDAAGRPRGLLALAPGDAALADLETLIERTRAPVAHDIVLAHAPPETWPLVFERGRCNIGCVAWETDRVPASWLPLLRYADRIVVPSRQNAQAVRRGGYTGPLAVIPHIRRHVWNSFAPSELAAARAGLGIRPDHTVFYSINAWDPRKALPMLIDAFARAFTAEDRVTLLLKTSDLGTGAPPLYPLRPTPQLAAEALAAATARGGRTAPSVVLVDGEIDGVRLDLLHSIGDVYATLSHGEGFGLGLFEAAMLGKPAIATGWGGQLDYLGADAPGLVPYRLVAAPLWPTARPGFFPTQRWAEADLEAAAARLRAAHDAPAPFVAHAAQTRARLYAHYGEPTLTRAWLATFDEARRSRTEPRT
jgi:glycosyltransferase involved in cell wall biosynthesis